LEACAKSSSQSLMNFLTLSRAFTDLFGANLLKIIYPHLPLPDPPSLKLRGTRRRARKDENALGMARTCIAFGSSTGSERTLRQLASLRIIAVRPCSVVFPDVKTPSAWFEHATPGLGNLCSIQLSYEGKWIGRL
jgi:hypothetical protein